MSFDTHAPRERKTFPFDSFDFYMTIYPDYGDISNTIFTQPVGQIRFDQEFDDFNFDKNYAQKVMKEMASVEEKIKEKIAAGIEPDITAQNAQSHNKTASESGNKLALDAARKKLKTELAAVDSLLQLVSEPKSFQNGEHSSYGKSIETLVNNINQKADNAEKLGTSSSSKTMPDDVLKLVQSVNVIGKDIIKDTRKLAELITQQQEEDASKKIARETEMNRLLAQAEQELDKINLLLENTQYGEDIRDEYKKNETNFHHLRKDADELSKKKLPASNFLNLSKDVTVGSEELLANLQTLSKRMERLSKDFAPPAKLENKMVLAKNAEEMTHKVVDETEKRKAIVESLPAEVQTKDFDESYNKVKEESKTVKKTIEKLEKTTDNKDQLKLSNQVIVASNEVVKAGEKNEIAYSKIQNANNAKKKSESASIRHAETNLAQAIQNAEQRNQKALSMLEEENREMKKAMGILDEELRKAQHTLDKFDREKDQQKQLKELSSLHNQTADLNDQTRAVNYWIDKAEEKITKQNELRAKQRQVKEFYDKSVLEHEKTIALMQQLEKHGQHAIPDHLLQKHEKSEASRLKLEKHHDALLAIQDHNNLLQLSQDVLHESKDLIAVTASYNAKLQALIDKEERKLAVKHIIEEAHSLAAETTIIANQTSSKLEEIDIEVDMLHLLDATRSAKHQAKKANYLTNELFDEMPLEAALQTLNQIKSKRHLALSNRNFVKEEVERLKLEEDHPTQAIYENTGEPIIKSTSKDDRRTIEIEEFEHNRKEIKQVTVMQKNAPTIIYQKVRHAWGGVYYFKNKESISQHNFTSETGEL